MAIDLTVRRTLLEAGSLTDDPRCRSAGPHCWLMRPTGDDTVSPAYPSILSQLAPRDARALHAIYEYVGGSYREQAVPIRDVAEAVDVIGEWAELAVENLQRLRLVKPAHLTFPGAVQESFDEGYLTSLGYDFVYHCRPPGHQLPGT